MQAGFVANMSDVAPRQSGVLFGLANTFGCAAGILGVSSAPEVVAGSGGWLLVCQCIRTAAASGRLSLWTAGTFCCTPGILGMSGK